RSWRDGWFWKICDMYTRMTMDAERGFWLQMIILTMVATAWLLLKVLTLYRHAQQRRKSTVVDAVPSPGRAAQAVPGAGIALMQPPDLSLTVQTLVQNAPSARYRFPLGWSC